MTTRSGDRLAPLPRAWLDVTMPLFRGTIGAAFVAFSSYATVFLFADDVLPIVGARMQLPPLEDRYWYGIVLALLFFLGEIYTSERWPRAYRAILVPDTIFTARQMFPGFLAAMMVLVSDTPSLILVLLLASGGILLVAYGALWSLRLWAGVGVGISGGIYATALLSSLDTARFLLTCLLALYCGYIVARFGETLLFGKRRKAPS